MALLACSFIFQSLQAQVKFYTVVSEPSISVRQTFQVRYVIEGAKEIKQLSIPGFNGFTVEDNFDVPNSGLNPPLPDVYSKVIVLSPKRTGRFIIPGASAFIDGRLMKSNPLKVTVQQGGPAVNNLNKTIEDIEREENIYNKDRVYVARYPQKEPEEIEWINKILNKVGLLIDQDMAEY